MSEEHAIPEQGNKPDETLPRSEYEEYTRLALGAVCDLVGGTAQASSEAIQTVDKHVSSGKHSLVEGILKGNARFLEGISHTMHAISERLHPHHAAGPDDSTESKAGPKERPL